MYIHFFLFCIFLIEIQTTTPGYWVTIMFKYNQQIENFEIVPTYILCLPIYYIHKRYHTIHIYYLVCIPLNVMYYKYKNVDLLKIKKI